MDHIAPAQGRWQTPLAMGLLHDGDGLTYRDGETIVLALRSRGTDWLVTDSYGDVVVTLLPLDLGDRPTITVLDPTWKTVGSITLRGADEHHDDRDLALFRDDGGATTLALRRDGPTGWHVVATDGSVVAVAGVTEADNENLEVLVLGSCPSSLVTQVLTLIATTELRVRGFLASVQ